MFPTAVVIIVTLFSYMGAVKSDVCEQSNVEKCRPKYNSFVDSTSKTFEDRCIAFKDLETCFKNQHCEFHATEKTLNGKAHVINYKVMEQTCTDEYRKISLNKDNEKCDNSDEVKSGVAACDAATSAHSYKASTPDLNCKTMNEIVRCMKDVYARCDKDFQQMRVVQLYVKTKELFEVYQFPSCDLDSDLRTIAGIKSGVTRFAWSYLLTTTAMLAALVIATSQ